MERFQSDYKAVIQKQCMQLYGFPGEELDKDKRHFELESHPRIAEIFLESVCDVSFLLCSEFHVI